jgi:hypothetical protein
VEEELNLEISKILFDMLESLFYLSQSFALGNQFGNSLNHKLDIHYILQKQES